MKATSKFRDGSNENAPPEFNPAEQAERCRRLAQATFDRTTSEMLGRMAEDFDRAAKSCRQ